MPTTEHTESQVVAGVHHDLPISTDATTSRMAVNNPAVRVVAFAMDAGQELTDHSSTRAVVVLVTDGRLEFGIGDDRRELAAGDIVYLSPGQRHAVLALEPCRFVLVMTDPPATGHA